MFLAIKASSAAAAAMMMALSPITGECEGRVMQLCSGDGVNHHIILWDDEMPLPSSDTSKACHACTLDKKRLSRKDLRNKCC